jgi:hypothetical protein
VVPAAAESKEGGVTAEELKALLIEAFMAGYSMARRDADFARLVAGGLIKVANDQDNPAKLIVTYQKL